MAEEEVRDYIHQILLGVQYMHKNNIVHLDLKVHNALITKIYKIFNSNKVLLVNCNC